MIRQQLGVRAALDKIVVRWLAALALVATTVSLMPQASWAGGFTWPENGTKAVGRGGAYMLGATGPEVVYFNPALLTRLEGHQITLDVNNLILDVSFQREGVNPDPMGDMEPYEKIENEFDGFGCCGFFPAPMVFISSDLGTDNFALGAALYGPSSSGIRRFPDSPTNRYILRESKVLLVYYSLAAGYHWNGLRIGATGQLAVLDTDFSLDTNTQLVESVVNNESPADNTAVRLTVSDVQPTGILGVAYDVNPSLSFGLTYSLPIRFEQEGTVELDISPNLEFLEPTLTDDRATFGVDIADVLRASARYAYIDDDRELFDVELTLTYERWSRTDAFDIGIEGDLDPSGTLDPIAVDDVIQKKGWEDTISVRLGGDAAVLPWLTLRTGVFYETPGVPNEFTHLDYLSWERYGIGVGTTFHVWDIDLDLGYMFIDQEDRTVTDGQVFVEAPLVDGETNAINNGKWTSSLQIFSLGATYRFDGPSNLSTTPVVPHREQ